MAQKSRLRYAGQTSGNHPALTSRLSGTNVAKRGILKPQGWSRGMMTEMRRFRPFVRSRNSCRMSRTGLSAVWRRLAILHRLYDLAPRDQSSTLTDPGRGIVWAPRFFGLVRPMPDRIGRVIRLQTGAARSWAI
jgi:hypothetical protein